MWVAEVLGSGSASGSTDRHLISVSVESFVGSLHACIQPVGESEHNALLDGNRVWELRFWGNRLVVYDHRGW